MVHRLNVCDRWRPCALHAVAILSCVFWISDWFGGTPADAAGSRRFAHSDSDKRYLHYIELYDANNRKITPESDQPYSPKNTCGRCHDYETISHGWHFNAFRSHTLRALAEQPDAAETDDADSEFPTDGRRGEPWIWTDPRTGTQLPLSYRRWNKVFNPAEIGITPYAMALHFGGRIPGGNFGSDDERSLLDQLKPQAAAEANESNPSEETEADKAEPVSRWKLSGDLEVDCLTCHAVSGQYDFENRRDTIRQENFAWAPTAGLRLGQIDGSVARIKEGSDPAEEAVAAKLPKVQYDARRFEPDNTVFIDLIRVPDNNSCYQCHSQRTVGEEGIDARWVHDQDVHLRAGMKCVDCHRNGIDHQIVRGFISGDQLSNASVTTLSCAGCHLGTQFVAGEAAESDHESDTIAHRAGRLGAPYPRHEGLPPIHFEKLTCTACHSGPIPQQQAVGLMTSLSHGLGEKAHREGNEMPSISGPVYFPTGQPHDSPVTAGRVMWPSYWGEIQGGKVKALDPETVYEVTRRALRVRRDFVEELTEVKISSKDRIEILGPLRGEVDDEELTAEEQQKLEEFQFTEGRKQFEEKIDAALEAIEKELNVEQAVYVSTATVFTRGESAGSLKEIDVKNPQAIEMVSWPMAHNVRPAGWSLGATGCLECHQDEALLFASTVTPTGPAPVKAQPVMMSSLQGIDEPTRLVWNQLFGGRKLFKFLIGASLLALASLMLLGMSTKAAMKLGATRS